MSDPPLVFSEVVKRKLILPKKARYTVADVRSVLTESLLHPVNGRTLSIAEAVFVVKCSAIYHETDYAWTVNARRLRARWGLGLSQ